MDTDCTQLLNALRVERSARKHAEGRAKAAEARVKELRRYLSKLGDRVETLLTDIDKNTTKRGSTND